MTKNVCTEKATDTPLVMEAVGEHGRKYWAVRGNGGYFLYRRSILTASEDELNSTEKVVDVLTKEVMRLRQRIDALEDDATDRSYDRDRAHD